MKKILLSAVAVFASFATFAQCISATGFYQDFNSPKDFYDAGKGIYPWGDTLNSTIAAPDPKDPNPGFYAPMTKANGKLMYTISTTENGYVPVGISFGTDTVTNKPVTIDLSSDASFAFKFKNNSTTGLKVRVAIQDINDSVIDTYAGTPAATAYTGIIEKTILGGKEVLWPDPSKETAATIAKYTWTNGRYASYKFKAPLGPGQTCPASNPSTLIAQGFDFKHVKGILITVINATDNLANCYGPKPISNVSFSIDSIRIGNIAACPTVLNGTRDAHTFSVGIAPNPSSDFTIVSYNATSAAIVNVYDLAGTLVKTVSGSNTTATVNTSDLTAGMYMLTVSVDGVLSKPEKLVIK